MSVPRKQTRLADDVKSKLNLIQMITGFDIIRLYLPFEWRPAMGNRWFGVPRGEHPAPLSVRGGAAAAGERARAPCAPSRRPPGSSVWSGAGLHRARTPLGSLREWTSTAVTGGYSYTFMQNVETNLTNLSGC